MVTPTDLKWKYDDTSYWRLSIFIDWVKVGISTYNIERSSSLIEFSVAYLLRLPRYPPLCELSEPLLPLL